MLFGLKYQRRFWQKLYLMFFTEYDTKLYLIFFTEYDTKVRLVPFKGFTLSLSPVRLR